MPTAARCSVPSGVLIGNVNAVVGGRARRVVDRDVEVRAGVGVDVVVDLDRRRRRRDGGALVDLGERRRRSAGRARAPSSSRPSARELARLVDRGAVVVRGVDHRRRQPAPGRAAERHVEVLDGEPVGDVGAVEDALVARALALRRARVRARCCPSSRTSRRRTRRRTRACWATRSRRRWRRRCPRCPSRVRPTGVPGVPSVWQVPPG